MTLRLPITHHVSCLTEVPSTTLMEVMVGSLSTYMSQNRDDITATAAEKLFDVSRVFRRNFTIAECLKI